MPHRSETVACLVHPGPTYRLSVSGYGGHEFVRSRGMHVLQVGANASVAVVIAALTLITACGSPGSSADAAKLHPVARPTVVLSGVEAPLKARTVAHVDTLHGVRLPDPYR